MPVRKPNRWKKPFPAGRAFWRMFKTKKSGPSARGFQSIQRPKVSGDFFVTGFGKTLSEALFINAASPEARRGNGEMGGDHRFCMSFLAISSMSSAETPGAYSSVTACRSGISPPAGGPSTTSRAPPSG